MDQQTKAGVAGAAIEIIPDGLKQASDSTGSFRFASVADGRHEITVRRLGYKEVHQHLDVKELGVGALVIALEAVPVELREVRIGGRLVDYPARFAEPYKRAASARGFYFTHDDIKALDAYDYRALLNRVPTVSANDRGVTFQRCQAGLGVRSGIIKAKVQVWVDGYRLTGRSSGRDEVSEVSDVLKQVPLSSIEIMEVYTGPSMIPPDFLDDACAVILIWTKRY